MRNTLGCCCGHQLNSIGYRLESFKTAHCLSQIKIYSAGEEMLTVGLLELVLVLVLVWQPVADT